MPQNIILNGFALMTALILVDYITGLAKAVKNKNVSSSVMREGLLRKFVYYLVAITALIIDIESGKIDLGFSLPLFIPTIIAISLIEVSSIMENASEIDPELKTSGIFNLFGRSGKDNSNEPTNTTASA
jgi:toxin secretion/phage lysis holin